MANPTLWARRAPTPNEPTGPDSELADLPAFAAPRAMPGPAHPDPAPPSTAASSTSTRATSPDGDGGRDGAASPSSGTGTSIPGLLKARAKSYAKVAEGLVCAVGGWLNKATGEVEEAFLPDDEDIETITPPLGRIAARRIKFGNADNLSDVEDIAMAAVGAAVWIAKGVTTLVTERRARRRLEKDKAVYDGQEEEQ